MKYLRFYTQVFIYTFYAKLFSIAKNTLFCIYETFNINHKLVVLIILVVLVLNYPKLQLKGKNYSISPMFYTQMTL